MSGYDEPDDAVDMIRQSAAGIADRQDLTRIRGLRFANRDFDGEVWRSICELGWPALRLPEEQGGVGLGVREYCALAEELGAALVPEPLIGASLAAQYLDGEDLATQLSGERLILPAWQEAKESLTPGDGTSFANGQLVGEKSYVASARAADAFVVVTTNGAYVVEADADGLELVTVQTQDGGHYGTLKLRGVKARRTDCAIGRAVDEAALATSAYLLGVIDAALSRTLEYLLTRVQFGKPIGSFQALQHRAVDLKLQAELTRASIDDAARQWDKAPGTPATVAAVSRAKARASSAAMLVTRQAVQLHGGIGFTDEHDIGLYLRKSMVLAPAYGSARAHRDRFAALMPTTQDQ